MSDGGDALTGGAGGAGGDSNDGGAAEPIHVSDVVEGLTGALETAQLGVASLRTAGVITEDGGIRLPLRSREEIGGEGGDGAREGEEGEGATSTESMIQNLTNTFHTDFHKGAVAIMSMFPENAALAAAVVDYERDWMEDGGRRVEFITNFCDRFGPYLPAIEESLDMHGLIESGDAIVNRVGASDMWNACARDDRCNIAKLARRLAASAKLVRRLPSTAMRRIESAVRSVRLGEINSFDSLSAVGQHLQARVSSEDADSLRDSVYAIASDLGGVQGICNILDAVGGAAVIERMSGEVELATREGGIAGLLQTAGAALGLGGVSGAADEAGDALEDAT